MSYLEKTLIRMMREAIKSHPKAKQWAKVNCEDNFCLAVYSTAEGAVLDVMALRMCSSDSKVAHASIDWWNDNCGTTPKLKTFVLTTCKEMYKVLRE